MMHDLALRHYLPTASPLVFGAMGLGGAWDDQPITRADVARARRCIEAARAAGITVFDHADIYALGKAEQAFGEALRERPSLRDEILIQSKCGIRFADAAGPKRYDLSRDWILTSVDGSLARLATDRLDILLLHRPDPLMDPHEIAEAFSRLHQSGRVRYFGVSNMYAHQWAGLAEVLDQPLIVNQMEMSLCAHAVFDEAVLAGHPDGADVHFAPGLIEQARRLRVQLQAWGSLCQGRLSGADIAADTPAVQRSAALVAELAEIYAAPPEAIVLAWLMRHPAGIQPVIGTTDTARIAACAQGVQIELSRGDWYRLYESIRGQALP